MRYEYPTFPRIEIGSGSQELIDEVSIAVRASLPVDPTTKLGQVWGEPDHGIPPNIISIGEISFMHYLNPGAIEKEIERVVRILGQPSYTDQLSAYGFPFLRADLYLPESFTDKERGEVSEETARQLVAARFSRYTLRLDGVEKIVPKEPTLVIPGLGREAVGMSQIEEMLSLVREQKAA